MPKIAEIEATPNPNAVKFILREPLSYGMARSYDNAEQAGDDELARALFAIEHVTNVFYVDRWLTVTQDGGAEWDELMRKIAIPLRDAPAAANGSAQKVAAAQIAVANMSEYDRGRLDAIGMVLDQHIRPYLQNDGGDLHILGLEGNRLTVHYQGACGTCPSSISGTLQTIEYVVRDIEPDIEIIVE